MSEPLDPILERAMRDLADIKRVIAKAEKEAESDGAERFSPVQIKLHAIVAGLTILAIILFWFNRLRFGLLLNRVHESLFWRFTLIGVLLTTVVMFALVLCIALRRMLRKEGEQFEDYFFRNFKCLRGVSLASDVIVKCTVISIVILAGRADWISPLLIIFTGDYLLQGRFFVLPIRTSLVLGFIFILSGIAYLLFFYGTLLYAFVPFLILTLLSLAYMLRASRSNSGRA